MKNDSFPKYANLLDAKFLDHFSKEKCFILSLLALIFLISTISIETTLFE